MGCPLSALQSWGCKQNRILHCSAGGWKQNSAAELENTGNKSLCPQLPVFSYPDHQGHPLGGRTVGHLSDSTWPSKCDSELCPAQQQTRNNRDAISRGRMTTVHDLQTILCSNFTRHLLPQKAALTCVLPTENPPASVTSGVCLCLLILTTTQCLSLPRLCNAEPHQDPCHASLLILNSQKNPVPNVGHPLQRAPGYSSLNRDELRMC